MPVFSAGLLVYRYAKNASVEVLLVHPGGPFWARKDEGAWSIPKGEYDEGADAFAAALREFQEEIGQEPPEGEPQPLGEVKQPSGKRISAWAVEGDLDASHTESNTFEIEWPRGSGTMQQFPEVDRAGWFDVADAREKLVKGQVAFLDLLLEIIASPS